ncbi:hypothetical protein XANCAGTX0491_005757 [Xanthoria calcicola]
MWVPLHSFIFERDRRASSFERFGSHCCCSKCNSQAQLRITHINVDLTRKPYHPERNLSREPRIYHYAPSGSAAIAGPVEEHHDLQILPWQMGAAFNRGKYCAVICGQAIRVTI